MSSDVGGSGGLSRELAEGAVCRCSEALSAEFCRCLKALRAEICGCSKVLRAHAARTRQEHGLGMDLAFQTDIVLLRTQYCCERGVVMEGSAFRILLSALLSASALVMPAVGTADSAVRGDGDGPGDKGGPAGLRVVRTVGDTRNATCLASAPEGAVLWVGTLGGGMVRWTQGGAQQLDATMGLPGNRVRDCRFHGDALWVATESGLARFDEAASWFDVVQRGRFLRLASAGPAMLAARADGVIHVFSRRSIRRQQLDLVPAALTGAPDGRWAAGGMDGRIYMDSVSMDGASQHRATAMPTAPSAMAAEPILHMAYAGDVLHVRTATAAFRFVGGVLQRSGQVAEAPAMAHPHAMRSPGIDVSGLGGKHVRAWARLQGDLVAATDEGVFRQAADGRWEPLFVAPMPCGDRISALARFDGALWAGSFDRGLCRWNGSTWSRYAGPSHLPSDMINDLAADDQHLYVATLKGLVLVDRQGRFDQRTHEQCVGDLKASCPWFASVTGVDVDGRTGGVWAADLGSVHRIDSKRWRHYGTRAGIGSRRITRIAVFDDAVAIGTSDQGVLLKKGDHVTTIDDQDGLADNWVTDLSWDASGVLWVATCTRGISRIDPDGSVSNMGSRHGLPDDYTLAVRPVGSDLWVGTLRGLGVVSGSTVTPLTSADGLSGDEVHDIVVYKKEVWVATNGGLSVIRRSSLPE